MNDADAYLPRDLQALRYLDAVNAGDLDTVAALWEEASQDPVLERILVELDGALFVEHATANVPAGTQRVPGWPAMRRRWAGVVGGLAAACVLVLFAWSWRDSKAPQSSAPRGASAHLTARVPKDMAGTPAWPEGRRVVDGAEMTTFHWPLPETSPSTPTIAIPPDLLD